MESLPESSAIGRRLKHLAYTLYPYSFKKAFLVNLEGAECEVEVTSEFLGCEAEISG
jgi:hypothetical protein